MKDEFNRDINYLRFSVTDRCNLRCRYCMPTEKFHYVDREELLSFDEITKVCEAAVECGIHKIKITGGEPLARHRCFELIGMISEVPGIEEVTLTTNGVLLEEMLPELLRNNLKAVNISIDSLDPELYRSITGRDHLDKVISSLKACVNAGLKTKVNAVLGEQLFEGIFEGSMEEKKDLLFQNCMQLLELAKDLPVDVRFIEMMPIGEGKALKMTSGKELIEYIRQFYPEITYDPDRHGNGPAEYYRIPGFKGGIGTISAIHGKFCDKCNRIRVTSTGQIKPCLCYDASYDLRAVLRDPSLDENVRKLMIRENLKKAIGSKPEAHCFEKPEEISEKNKMVSIGG